MKERSRSTLLLVASIALLAIALLVSPGQWIEWLRGTPETTEPLLQGTLVFRVVLGATALYLAGWWFIGWHPATRISDEAEEAAGGWARFAVPALLLVAAALRVIQLDAGMWLDEVVTMVHYAGLSPGEIVTTYDLQNQHFLYSILAHWCVTLFGSHEWTLRLPAVAFGVAGVWALVLLGREIATSREALWAGALLVVSPHHVWFSQNARGYTAIFFFSVFCTWLLLRALRNGTLRRWSFYGVCVALGVFSHQSMLFVVAGHLAAYAYWAIRKRAAADQPWWQPLAAGFVSAGLLTLLLHAFALPQILARTADEVSPVAVWRSPIWLIQETLAGLTGAVGVVPLVVAAVGGSVVLLAGVISLGSGSRLVPILTILPPLLGGIVVIAFQHHLWPRFFFFAFGLGLLAIVRGVFEIVRLAGPLVSGRARLTYHLQNAAVGMVILASLWLLPTRYGPKQDFIGAREWVAGQVAPSDRVISVGMAGFVYHNWYERSWPYVEDAVEFDRARDEVGTTWVLYTLPFELEASRPRIMESITRDYDVVASFPGTLGGGEVYVARTAGAPSSGSRD